MDGSFLLSLGIWTWFLIAGVLMILELAAPGIFMFWFGIGAFATGLISLVFVDMPWPQELLVFAVLALASVVIGRRVMQHVNARGTDRPHLNQRMQSYVGRQFTLVDPIVDGTGRVRIDDSVWRVSGPNTPAGTVVRVARVEGGMLVVEPA